MTQYNDKFYFKACAFFRKNGKISESDVTLVQKKAQDLRNERAKRIQIRNGN